MVDVRIERIIIIMTGCVTFVGMFAELMETELQLETSPTKNKLPPIKSY